jgi:hypothetical protein
LFSIGYSPTLQKAKITLFGAGSRSPRGLVTENVHSLSVTLLIGI